MAAPVSELGRTVRRTGWMVPLALSAILFSLAALVAVPPVLRGRMVPLREEIDAVADPAREDIGDVRLDLARELTRLTNYAATGDGAELDRYRTLRELEDSSMVRLAGRAAALSPAAAAEVAAFDVAVDAWHATVERGELLEGAVPATGEIDSLVARGLYDDALGAADRAERVLEAEIAARRARIRAEERVAFGVSTGLAVLALVAASGVAWLGWRVRELGVEAQRRAEQAQNAIEARERFIRGVTHDLKNPLGVVDGYAELLELGLRGEISEEQRRVVGRIRASVRSLQAALADLVELSRAETGALPLLRTPVDLAGLAASVAEDHRPLAEAAGLALVVEADAALPPVYADERRVRQVVENLVSNAVKYTDRGTVTMRVRDVVVDGAAGAPHAGHWAVVEVEDTGPGIADGDRERVFEEFVRLEGTADRGGGSGVGLAISRAFARAMGGDVTLRSEVGRGSVFTLWLPRRAEE